MMVKHGMDTYCLSAKLGLAVGLEYVTLDDKGGVKGINFDEEYVSIKAKDVKPIYEEVRNELGERHLYELSAKEVAKLEKQIVFGSVFMSDYENTLGVSPKEVCNYAEGFLETQDKPDEYGYYDSFYEYIKSVDWND